MKRQMIYLVIHLPVERFWASLHKDADAFHALTPRRDSAFRALIGFSTRVIRRIVYIRCGLLAVPHDYAIISFWLSFK